MWSAQETAGALGDPLHARPGAASGWGSGGSDAGGWVAQTLLGAPLGSRLCSMPQGRGAALGGSGPGTWLQVTGLLLQLGSPQGGARALALGPPRPICAERRLLQCFHLRMVLHVKLQTRLWWLNSNLKNKENPPLQER